MASNDLKETLTQKHKSSQQEKMLELLDEEYQRYAYLDQGFCEQNNVLWYGFKLGGKEAIILSDGQILRNLLERTQKGEFFGENEIVALFRYKGYLSDIAPLVDNSTIKKFYLHKISNKKRKLIGIKELYREIRDKILYYMDFHGKDEIADVLTCWIIGTYGYSLFYWFPHILINAPRESGKSKCGYIVTQLSFRGYDIGAAAGVTPAQVFRTIEGNRGTMFFDEYENSNFETQKLVNQIMNASATRDAYVIRCEQINKKWKSWKFPIFCPKVVCNISGINPTSLTRFIGFKWLKTKSAKASRKPYREQDKKSFEPIRAKLYLFMLENWQTIKEIYDSSELTEIRGRQEDNWLPLFAVAKCIDSSRGEPVNAENQLGKYLETYKEIEIETDDPTEQFFGALIDLVDENPQYYSPGEIAEWVDIKELLSNYKSPSTWIGKKFRLYQFRRYRIIGKRKYLLSKERVAQILDIYFGTDIVSPSGTSVTKRNQCNQVTPVTPKVEKIDDSIYEEVSLGDARYVPERGGVSDRT